MGKINYKGNKKMDKLVATPGGLKFQSDIHYIEKGNHVNYEGGNLTVVENLSKKIIHELGNTEIYDNKNLIPLTTLQRFKTADLDSAPSPITDAWIIYAGWLNETNRPITFFSTSWVVPPPPSTDNGQLIYIFNGIEDASFNTILQPVLQWGVSPAGGGSFWAIANWFVIGKKACHGELVRVNSGDHLQGIMAMTGQNAGLFNYRSAFHGHPNADLEIDNVAELIWAVETLECYDLKQFSDYPNTLKTAMSGIEIRLGNTQAPIQWEAFNDVTDNGQHCSIISNASPQGRVDLFYKEHIA